MENAPSPHNTPSDYLGLKTELQNIAGIIEQYPDHLKQRAFELLITSYLGNNQAKEIKEAVAPQVQEAQAVESAPATVAAPVAEVPVPDEGFSTPSVDPDAFTADSEPVVSVIPESTANLLRRRIRLRTMSPMRWQTTN